MRAAVTELAASVWDLLKAAFDLIAAFVPLVLGVWILAKVPSAPSEESLMLAFIGVGWVVVWALGAVLRKRAKGDSPCGGAE